MKVIDTKQSLYDIESQLSPEYFKLLKGYFQQLLDAFHHDKSDEYFSLRDQHILMIVPESEKELKCHIGTLGPEFVEIHQLEKECVFQVNVLEDNERMTILFVRDEKISHRMKERLKRFLA